MYVCESERKIHRGKRKGQKKMETIRQTERACVCVCVRERERERERKLAMSFTISETPKTLKKAKSH